MKANVGQLDRATRWTVGFMMTMLACSGVVSGVRGGVLLVLGLALVASGVSGRCLLYRAFGWSTLHPPRDGGLTSP